MKLSTWKNMVIGLLVILNLAALSTIWLGHRSEIGRSGFEQHQRIPHDRPAFGPHGRQSEQQPPLERIMVETLDLNDEQSKAFRELKETHHRQSRELQNDIRSLKEFSFEAISEGNREEAEEIAGKIGLRQTEMELMLFDHFSDIRALCNEDQQERFDEMISRIGQRIHPGPRQDRGPRH